jgi:NADH-quinone oxidoreductase subunit C
MDQESIKQKILSRFGEDVAQDVSEFRDQIAVTVDPAKILDVLSFLKTDPELEFDFLSFVTAVDRYPETPRFEMVYQINSLKNHHRFRVKALIEESPDGRASIDSVVGIWGSAEWHEREASEMFGITFRNHPDPRKLLLPETWEIYPLRKDFPVEGTEEDTPDLPGGY